MPRDVGRYTLYDEIASGGMATVFLARQRGEVGFSRVVAVKMLHAQYAKEEAFRAMFLDEARLVSRIRHKNVVATLDVVQDAGELFLVMEYVHGETLSRLLRHTLERGETVPLGVAVAIVVDMLEGLHAAHEATSERGEPLHIVHRDVSPQNVLVAADGIAHVADFGVAKAVGRLAEKYSNQAVKGKAGYMPPEQMRGGGDRRADVYAAGVVLWETLVGQRLFPGDSFLEIVTKALDAPIHAPSTLRPDVPAALDAVVLRATSRDASKRFTSAREMALALEAAHPKASARDVGEWVRRTAAEGLAKKAAELERIETGMAESDATAPPREPASQPSIATVSGLAPSLSSVPVRPVWPWLLVAGAVVAGVTVTLYEVRRPHAAVAAIPPPPVVTSPAPVVPPAPSVTALETASVVQSPTPPQHVTHTAVRPHATATATPACHWVELPNEQGIMIPKKVCQ